MGNPLRHTSRKNLAWPKRWLALATLALLAMTSMAHADCWFSGSSSTGTYSVSVPTTLINDPSIAIGATLYTSISTPINQTVNFNCYYYGNYWGLVNRAGANPTSGQYLFPIGATGVSFRITQTSGNYPGLVGPWPFQSLDGSNNWSESDPVTVELVKTGTIADGTVIAGALADFQAGTTSGNIRDATIMLANSLTFVAPACNVPSNLTVVLPTVTTGAFSSKGSTTGTQPFSISLVCSSGTKLAITLDSSAASNKSQGVLANSGTATNVGVQLVWNGAPGTSGTSVALGSNVTFNAAKGTTQIPLIARYYAIQKNPAAGSVTATATYTLTYP